MSNVVPVPTAADLVNMLDPTESVLLVRPLGFDSETEEERAEQIAILSATEGLGNKSQAFLAFGIPGSGRYSFFDMNHLPPNYVVDLVISDRTNNRILSKNHWEGTSGNQPQPTSGE